MKSDRLLTIQDISCLGKCSITVALPIISCLGIECCVIPSAVLSTHTSIFKNYTFKDLTDQLNKITEHWDSYEFDFDAVYTGYIANKNQLEIISNIFNKYKSRGSKIFVDPVMGDNGVAYAGFDKDFVDNMRNLCRAADLIMPNITEACLLLESEYCGSVLNQNQVESLLKKLSKINSNTIVLTGISFENDKIGAAIYDVKKQSITYCFSKKIQTNFHGTGDIFASVLSGGLVKGWDIVKATQCATDFVSLCIQQTVNHPQKRWYGVNFENALCMLTQKANN